MSNLNNRGIFHPRWRAAGVGVLRDFEACVIAIFDMNSKDNGDNFDPRSPLQSTSIPRRIWQGPAQMQVYRQSLTMDDVAGSVTQIRSIRFMVDLDEVVEPIHKGLIVRVVSSGGDPANEHYEFTVTSALNSPLALKRTIEAEADMMVVAQPITEFTT